MKRPIVPKRNLSSRPKLTTRTSVRIKRPSCNHSGAARPSTSTR
jgi:hypothetical protein